MKKSVLILLGGRSAERKISFLTGKACISALKKKGYKNISFIQKTIPDKIK